MNLWKEKGDQILMDAKYIDSLHYYKSRSLFCCLIRVSLTRFSMLANDFTWLSMQYSVCLFLSVNLRFHVKLDKRWSWAAQYCTATNERQVAAGDFFRPPQCRFVGGATLARKWSLALAVALTGDSTCQTALCSGERKKSQAFTSLLEEDKKNSGCKIL